MAAEREAEDEQLSSVAETVVLVYQTNVRTTDDGDVGGYIEDSEETRQM